MWAFRKSSICELQHSWGEALIAALDQMTDDEQTARHYTLCLGFGVVGLNYNLLLEYLLIGSAKCRRIS